MLASIGPYQYANAVGTVLSEKKNALLQFVELSTALRKYKFVDGPQISMNRKISLHKWYCAFTCSSCLSYSYQLNSMKPKTTETWAS